MKIAICLTAALTAAMVTTAVAQQAPADKPSVGKYLADGYEVLRAEIGSPFLQFILQKKTATGQALVWCSVQLQNGETTSCRTIK
jgi:hypothetical protein